MQLIRSRAVISKRWCAKDARLQRRIENRRRIDTRFECRDAQRQPKAPYLERWRCFLRLSFRRFMRFLCHLGRMPRGRLTVPMTDLR
jgi:hypothetical protein